VKGPQAHLAGHAVALKAIQPRLRAKLADLQIETVAIAVESGLFGILDRQRGLTCFPCALEFELPCTMLRTFCAYICPHRCASARNRKNEEVPRRSEDFALVRNRSRRFKTASLSANASLLSFSASRSNWRWTRQIGLTANNG
jgi:hypothetical protein